MLLALVGIIIGVIIGAIGAVYYITKDMFKF